VADLEVTKTLTPITARSLYAAIESLWPALIGGPFAPLAGVVLVAQSAQETGAWAAVYNYNLGGQKYVPGTGEDFFWSTTTEGQGSSATVVQARFAAFPSLAAGISNWLKLIHAHYPNAWAAAMAGDPSSFVAALKAGGYFTGNLASYTSRVVGFFNQWRAMLTTSGGPPTPSGATVASSGELPPAIFALGATLGAVAVYRAIEWAAEHARVRALPRRRRARRN
jgi:hypothetical protein